MNFPCSYILLDKNCDINHISSFLKGIIGERINSEIDGNFILIHYPVLENDFVKEALESYNNEGFITVKAYCSKVIKNIKEFELEYSIIKEKLANVVNEVYDYKSLLFESSKLIIDKKINDLILKNYSNDEDMKKIILGLMDANLNVSKAASNLFMHRNTLIYKLDKFYEITGYDVRNFNDAYFIGKILGI